MTAPMIKSVSLALFDADDVHPDRDAGGWEYWDALATAAIEAMRNPNAGMLIDMAYFTGDLDVSEKSWQAAITAALGEGGE